MLREQEVASLERVQAVVADEADALGAGWVADMWRTLEANFAETLGTAAIPGVLVECEAA